MVVDRVTQIRVGIFVSTGLLLAMLVIFLIGSERSWFEQKYALHCTFSEVSGVGPGAPVSLAGMRVGAVKAVGFSSDPERADVMIELEITKKFQDRIRADSRASIVTQGLLGDKMIMVSVGTPKADILQPGDELPTASSGDLASLGLSAEGIIREGQVVIKQAQELLQQVKTGSGVLHALFYDPQGGEIIRDLAASAHSVSAVAARIAREADIAVLRQAFVHFRAAAADAEQIVAAVRRGEGSLGGLLADSAIYEEIRSIFGKANRNVLVKSVIRSMLREQEAPIARTR